MKDANYYIAIFSDNNNQLELALPDAILEKLAKGWD